MSTTMRRSPGFRRVAVLTIVLLAFGLVASGALQGVAAGAAHRPVPGPSGAGGWWQQTKSAMKSEAPPSGSASAERHGAARYAASEAVVVTGFVLARLEEAQNPPTPAAPRPAAEHAPEAPPPDAEAPEASWAVAYVTYAVRASADGGAGSAGSGAREAQIYLQGKRLVPVKQGDDAQFALAEARERARDYSVSVLANWVVRHGGDAADRDALGGVVDALVATVEAAREASGKDPRQIACGGSGGPTGCAATDDLVLLTTKTAA